MFWVPRWILGSSKSTNWKFWIKCLENWPQFCRECLESEFFGFLELMFLEHFRTLTRTLWCEFGAVPLFRLPNLPKRLEQFGTLTLPGHSSSIRRNFCSKMKMVPDIPKLHHEGIELDAGLRKWPTNMTFSWSTHNLVLSEGEGVLKVGWVSKHLLDMFKFPKLPGFQKFYWTLPFQLAVSHTRGFPQLSRFLSNLFDLPN